MLKKTITYRSVDNEELTEDFYFHIKESEIAELEISKKGGIREYFMKLVEADDGETIIKEFKKIIGMAYGRRSEDGKSFIKEEKDVAWFLGTEAYSNLFMELLDAKYAAAFFKAIFPDKFKAAIEAALTGKEDETPPWISENRKPTKQELNSMTKDQLIEVMKRDTAEKIDDDVATS